MLRLQGETEKREKKIISLRSVPAVWFLCQNVCTKCEHVVIKPLDVLFHSESKFSHTLPQTHTHTHIITDTH